MGILECAAMSLILMIFFAAPTFAEEEKTAMPNAADPLRYPKCKKGIMAKALSSRRESDRITAVMNEGNHQFLGGGMFR